MEKAREFQSLTDYIKAFDCVDHSKLWKILKGMNLDCLRLPDHLTCLLRNLYMGQEATVTTRHGTIEWFQIGKGVPQSCILSAFLLSPTVTYLFLLSPIYITYMQSTSCEMPRWMNHKLESRLVEEISTALDLQITAL